MSEFKVGDEVCYETIPVGAGPSYLGRGTVKNFRKNAFQVVGGKRAIWVRPDFDNVVLASDVDAAREEHDVSDPTSPSHYTQHAIEPLEFILKNKLDFCEGNVVKYVSRWRSKGGVEDLKKARTYLDRLIKENEP